jgi:lipid-A-disaccharide synthase
VTLTLGILAGEPSGDRLAAGLMKRLRRHRPGVRFVGVGGEAMVTQGLEPIASADTLAINGFVQPVLHLPALLRLLRRLLECFDELQPDAFIGVDFNVFNLLLETRLRRRGIPTAHYVSPSVYAWRPARVRRVDRAAELLLTLFPFEPGFYADLPVRAEYVGHPLADEIGPDSGSAAQRLRARQALGIAPDVPCVAVLPGSRVSEVQRLLDPFLAACERLAERLENVVFVVPCVNGPIERLVREGAASRAGISVSSYRGDARQALTACDVALVKSGTGTLEAMLLRRPMVVSYRLGAVSFRLVRRLLTTPFVALPNILAGRELVPELLQHDATPDALAAALIREREAARHPGLLDEFARLHAQLRRGADERAARAVLAWLDAR